MEAVAKISEVFGTSTEDLIQKSLISFIEKETRLAEEDIANLRDRYDCVSKEGLYKAIESKKIVSHPAWEDYIVWKNKENHIQKMTKELKNLI